MTTLRSMQTRLMNAGPDVAAPNTVPPFPHGPSAISRTHDCLPYSETPPNDPRRHCRPTAPRCAGPHGPWHGFRTNAQHVPGRLAVGYYKQRTGVPGTVTIIEGTVIAAQAGGVEYWYVER